MKPFTMSTSRQQVADRSAKRRSKARASKAPAEPVASIKLRLDHRTTITCKPQSIAFWKARYPKLTVIE